MFCRIILAAAVLAAAVVPAEAQFVRREPPRRGSVDLSGGALWTAGSDEPNPTATLTRNPSTGSGPFDLFKSDTTLGSAIGLRATIGFYLSPSVSLEGGVEISRPELRVRLSDDFEDAPDTTATETLTSYVFGGSLVYHFRKPGRAFTPFVLAGAGHVRDLHEGSDLVDTGVEYHGGVGAKWWLGTGRQKLGLRADGAVSIRNGGFGTDDERRLVPTAALSLAYLF